MIYVIAAIFALLILLASAYWEGHHRGYQSGFLEGRFDQAAYNKRVEAKKNHES